MLVNRRVTPSVKFAGTHLYTWVERGTVRVKCLAQKHNTMSPARARTQTAWSGLECNNREATASLQIFEVTAVYDYLYVKMLIKCVESGKWLRRIEKICEITVIEDSFSFLGLWKIIDNNVGSRSRNCSRVKRFTGAQRRVVPLCCFSTGKFTL